MFHLFPGICRLHQPNYTRCFRKWGTKCTASRDKKTGLRTIRKSKGKSTSSSAFKMLSSIFKKEIKQTNWESFSIFFLTFNWLCQFVRFYMYVIVDAAEFRRHISVLFIQFTQCNQWHVLGIFISKNALTGRNFTSRLPSLHLCLVGRGVLKDIFAEKLLFSQCYALCCKSQNSAAVE